MVETSRNYFYPVSNDRNTFVHYLASFSDLIQGSSAILLVELYVIYKGLLLAKDMNIYELICYSDSLHCVNFIKSSEVRYHIHAVLIQDIKELLSQINASLYHTLRERNECVNFFAKLGASSDAIFLTYVYPSEDIRDLLKNNVMRTFLRSDNGNPIAVAGEDSSQMQVRLGFLFLHCHKALYLWNPSTGIHKEIPNSPLTIASNHCTFKLLCGFAYEPLTDDYFVVLGSFDASTRAYGPIDLEIFSLRTNKWKQIEVDSHLPYTNTANTADGPIVGLFLNGSIYWLVHNYETRRNDVIALDLKEMRLSEIAIPVDFYRDSSFIDYDLFVFGGLISVWIVEDYTVEIWVMQDFGVHISWTKTVNFSYHPAPNFNPIYFTNCGDIVGTVGDGGLVKFDDKGLLLNYRSNDDCFFDRSQMVVYTESLLSFPDVSEQA
ncbi:F-box/kelch-repeat protein [Trifolium repens]|nr:F-box/kelch-repeat protein [Trifolium repens]